MNMRRGGSVFGESKIQLKGLWQEGENLEGTEPEEKIFIKHEANAPKGWKQLTGTQKKE